MIDQNKSLPSTGGEWMEWPTQLRPNDIRECAFAVIAITRHEWASGRSAATLADETSISRGGFEHTLLESTADTKSRIAGVGRVIRKRSRPGA
jgi:hypothetical protein